MISDSQQRNLRLNLTRRREQCEDDHDYELVQCSKVDTGKIRCRQTCKGSRPTYPASSLEQAKKENNIVDKELPWAIACKLQAQGAHR